MPEDYVAGLDRYGTTARAFPVLGLMLVAAAVSERVTEKIAKISSI